MANEFVGKKLGEVAAFANVGKELFERGRAALNGVFTEKGVNTILHDISIHALELNKLAAELGTSDVTSAKCEKTSAKLRQMMEMYVGEEWDNPAELLEWLGFFEGATLIHWELVAGTGEALANMDTQELAGMAITFHQKLLTDVGTRIHEVGAKKALT